jgi:hypothetical protein
MTLRRTVKEVNDNFTLGYDGDGDVYISIREGDKDVKKFIPYDQFIEMVDEMTAMAERSDEVDEEEL